MQTIEAIKFLKDAAAKSPINVLQAFQNASLGSAAEAEAHSDEIRPIIELLSKSKEIHAYIDALAESARHQYSCHGSSFETICFSVLLAGFVGGIQFFMNGGIASPPSAPVESSTAPRLLN